MVPVAMPDRCPRSLLGEAGACRTGGAGWRDRTTGPCHALRRARCHVHGGSFTLYGPGWIPHARLPIFVGAGADGETDAKASLVGAAVAVCRGERWPEELVDDERGPVGRTQRRWVAKLASVLGLGQSPVPSAVLSELGLEAIVLGLTLAERVAALAQKAADPSLWLHLAAALDLVGAYGRVGVMEGLQQPRLAPARGCFARALRGPP